MLFIKIAAEGFESLLLNAGDITPGNVQSICYFALCQRKIAIKSIAQSENVLFTRAQMILQDAIHLLALQVQIDIIEDIALVRYHIAPCDTVSVFVDINGIAQVQIMGRFLFVTKMHKDFIFNTAAGVCSKFRTFAEIKAGYRFNQADGTDGD